MQRLQKEHNTIPGHDRNAQRIFKSCKRSRRSVRLRCYILSNQDQKQVRQMMIQGYLRSVRERCIVPLDQSDETKRWALLALLIHSVNCWFDLHVSMLAGWLLLLLRAWRSLSFTSGRVDI